jgi:hypothetical protein
MHKAATTAHDVFWPSNGWIVALLSLRQIKYSAVPKEQEAGRARNGNWRGSGRTVSEEIQIRIPQLIS